MAVIAVIPCTPQAAKAFTSAWMPAPPPESDPAIDSTRGTLPVDTVRGYSGHDREPPSRPAPDIARQLEPSQAGQCVSRQARLAQEGGRGVLTRLNRREQRPELGAQLRALIRGSNL